MANSDEQYRIKLNRCCFSSVYGVNREIENLEWIIKDFEAEATARANKERENRIARENAEKAKRIVNEHATFMKIVNENPIFIDKFNAAMNRTTS